MRAMLKASSMTARRPGCSANLKEVFFPSPAACWGFSVLSAEMAPIETFERVSNAFWRLTQRHKGSVTTVPSDPDKRRRGWRRAAGVSGGPPHPSMGQKLQGCRPAPRLWGFRAASRSPLEWDEVWGWDQLASKLTLPPPTTSSVLVSQLPEGAAEGLTRLDAQSQGPQSQYGDLLLPGPGSGVSCING